MPPKVTVFPPLRHVVTPSLLVCTGTGFYEKNEKQWYPIARPKPNRIARDYYFSTGGPAVQGRTGLVGADRISLQDR